MSPPTTSGIAGSIFFLLLPQSDMALPAGDLGDGERHCRGDIAPFVRIFRLRLPAEAGLGISSKDPLIEDSLELAAERIQNIGGCSPSVPLPSEHPLAPLYTTVSHENSEEDALVEVPDSVVMSDPLVDLRPELLFPLPFDADLIQIKHINS